MSPSDNDSVELSVIVPVLNEAVRLPGLLELLEQQTGLRIEVLLCDGGSDDNSCVIFEKLSSELSYPCRFINSAKGRAVQLNAGASVAKGEFFLFLHADSKFQSEDSLSLALTSLKSTLRPDCHVPVAGHFRLSFDETTAELSRQLKYWELKARLDRVGCTHGDQGFLMHRTVYDSVGPFAEDWAIFEDTLFAEDIRNRGHWVLLPSTLITSARRFSSEGISERQTLNALLMNFCNIGWRSYFQTATSIYRQQSATNRLSLYPFLKAIRDQLSNLTLTERTRLWYRTGCFVRRNAWQLLLAHRVRSGRWNLDTPVVEIELSLARFDRRFDALTQNPPGCWLTALLTWCWFQLLSFREKPLGEQFRS